MTLCHDPIIYLQVVSLLVQYTGPDSGRRGRGGERDEDEDEEDCNCNTSSSKTSTVRQSFSSMKENTTFCKVSWSTLVAWSSPGLAALNKNYLGI